MERSYTIRTEPGFDRSLKKLVKNNLKFRIQIKKVLKILATKPFDTRLKTHKVYTKNLGEAFSSRVTGDIRILWIFSGSEQYIILCLTVGGHDKVY
jgi:mRNA-degrading endonuclease YafQ of YafQ-DinJ toxin-antitoxin module